MIVDAVLALLAVLGLGAFLYIIVDFVPADEYALQVVFAVGLAMAAFDFARNLWRERKSRRDDDDGGR
jgi:membrane protein implicated in regulation of membrane protease activity